MRNAFIAATAAVVLHIAFAELVDPPAGTGARDHLLAALLPIAVAVAACALLPRLRTGLQAAVAAVFGIVTLVGAAAAGGETWTAWLLYPAAVVYLVLGVAWPWRKRGRGTRRSRVVALLAAPVVLMLVVAPLGAALWTTQKARTAVGTFAVPHQDVSFRTRDGLTLSGWYVPSRNGAAVVIVHGGGGSRDGAKGHAALLGRAGYGVLLYDARGRGTSEGDTDAYGWTWRDDVDGAIDWLHRRGITRVGALGLSTGADVLLAVAAERHDLRAVVADGTTAESTGDVAAVSHGADKLMLPFWVVQYAAASVLEQHRQSKPLADLARHVAPTKFLFIASNWQVERDAAPRYARAAHARLWRVDAGHTGGLREHPRAYAQHVLGFFAQTLR